MAHGSSNGGRERLRRYVERAQGIGEPRRKQSVTLRGVLSNAKRIFDRPSPSDINEPIGGLLCLFAILALLGVGMGIAAQSANRWASSGKMWMIAFVVSTLALAILWHIGWIIWYRSRQPDDDEDYD